MSDVTPARRRVHPVDLLVLLMALAGAALAYAFLFKRTPLPSAVDKFLGTDISVVYELDRGWKRDFPTVPASLQLGQLHVDVTGKEALGDGTMRLDLKVRGRDDQHPDAILQFRGGLRRGATLRLWDDEGEVEVEVLELKEAGDGSGD